ncbi:MAG TPA: hypothetical protein VHU84_12155, partial [Lacipirellulaceae bacterium]|nr:hypothetical protein [Lacipirellulaceae bacterium]
MEEDEDATNKLIIYYLICDNRPTRSGAVHLRTNNLGRCRATPSHNGGLSMSSIKTGIIGTGFIGPAHIEAIRRLGFV